MPDDKKTNAKPEDPRVAAARKRAAELAKAAGGGGGQTRTDAGQFLREVWSELKKTTWPDRETLTKSVYVVLAFIVAAGVWVFIIDLAMTRITAPLFGK